MKKKKDTKSNGELKNENNGGSYLGEDFLDYNLTVQLQRFRNMDFLDSEKKEILFSTNSPTEELYRYLYEAKASKNLIFAADKGWELTGSISSVAVPLAFLQMILRATDIPFALRYGNKKGGITKLIYSIAFVIIISVLILTNAGNFSVILYESGEKLFTEDNISLALGIVCMIALTAYYISYRISCRVYLKGVEQYDH